MPTAPPPLAQGPRHGVPPCTPIARAHIDMDLLEALRQAARRARVGRHITLAQANRLLECPGAASGAPELVVRTLGEVLGRRPVFHAPGSAMVSFDEAWLVRLHAAQVMRDTNSVALLVGRRVPVAVRRGFLDLLRRIDRPGAGAEAA